MIYQVDPLTDPRYSELLRVHPVACVFHSPGWLEALRRTYGYDSIAFTMSPPDAELKNAVLFCVIRSWLTGSRMVSLPFSDHCDPLVGSANELQQILDGVLAYSNVRNDRYIELRPRSAELGIRFKDDCIETFCLHTLNLEPDTDKLLRTFHPSCVCRKIRRAQREALDYEEGRSESLLRVFYGLLTVTRRRHHIPSQPIEWFRNLIECMGNDLKIRLASKNGQAIAGMLTLRFKDSMVYKYGCSDKHFHSLGGVSFLLWKSILEAKESGLKEFDFGRSDLENRGLIRFKDHWGTCQSALYYIRKVRRSSCMCQMSWIEELAKRMFAYAPGGLREAAGRMLYRHVG